MSVKYATFEEAKSLEGIKLLVIKGIPSPWSEAAKAILEVKKIPYTAVAFDAFNAEQQAWFQANNAPALKQGSDATLIDWLDILEFAEQTSPTPSLLPQAKGEKDTHLALCHSLCSKLGLGWQRRLQSVHLGLNEMGGFPIKIAHYLAAKYGYQTENSALYESEIIRILGELTARLKQNALSQNIRADDKEGAYYFGENLTALDIYSAMFMAYFKPLAQDVCPMYPSIRLAFETYSPEVAKALDPVLLQHRDLIYSRHLELPLSI